MRFTQAIIKHKKGELLRKIPNSKYFELMEEFIWYIQFEGKNYYIIIPKGFLTDFGSIPFLIKDFIDPIKYIAFILHDWTYDEDCRIYFDGKLEDVPRDLKGCEIEIKDGKFILIPTRKIGDIILAESLLVEGAGKLTINIIYYGLKIGGKRNFRKKKIKTEKTKTIT